MVSLLGVLNADRTAVVTLSGIAKLQAKHIADPSAKIFSSMMRARTWALGTPESMPSPSVVYDEPSEAAADGQAVHVQGPSGTDIAFTPIAALETARRISGAAVEVLLKIPPLGQNVKPTAT
jgi:hypothetical protein